MKNFKTTKIQNLNYHQTFKFKDDPNVFVVVDFVYEPQEDETSIIYIDTQDYDLYEEDPHNHDESYQQFSHNIWGNNNPEVLLIP